MASGDQPDRTRPAAAATGASEDVPSILGRLDTFAGLDLLEIQELLRIGATRRLRAGAVLFHKGAKGAELYIVLRGMLKVTSADADGHELVLRILDPGEVIGEIALLDGQPRSATITAIDASELLVIHRSELLAFLHEHPSVAVKMLEVAAMRLRSLSQLLEDKTFLAVPSRLARRLLALGERYGRQGPAGLHIELALSQRDLGDMIGTTRESINKQIGIWTRAGVLVMDHRRITIRDAEPLQQLADDAWRLEVGSGR